MEQNPSSFLEFPLSDGALQTFDSVDAVRAWVQREQEFWGWLDKIAPAALGLSDDQRPRLFKSLRAIRNTLNPNPPESFNLGSLKASLAQYAKLGLVSSTPRGAFVQSLRERFGDVAAAASVAQYLGSIWGQPQNVPLEQRHLIELGRHAVAFFDFGLGEDVNVAFQTSIEQLTGDFRTRSDQQLSAFRSELSAIKAEREQATAERLDWAAQTKKTWQEALERINQEAVAALESIKNTEKAFKEQMKLRASVKYWEKESSKHTARGHWQKGFILVYALAVCALAFCSVPPAFEFVKATALALEGKSSTPLLILAGMGIFIVSVALWIARILVRVYVEERHRALDASERAVMAETYQALTNEGTVTESERVLVLSSMFRPAGDSPTKEEGPEMLQHAILAKLLDAKPVSKG
jgi:hypothetical protein